MKATERESQIALLCVAASGCSSNTSDIKPPDLILTNVKSIESNGRCDRRQLAASSLEATLMLAAGFSCLSLCGCRAARLRLIAAARHKPFVRRSTLSPAPCEKVL